MHLSEQEERVGVAVPLWQFWPNVGADAGADVGTGLQAPAHLAKVLKQREGSLIGYIKMVR